MNSNYDEISRLIGEIKNNVNEIRYDMELFERKLMKNQLDRLERQQGEIIEQQNRIMKILEDKK